MRIESRRVIVAIVAVAVGVEPVEAGPPMLHAVPFADVQIEDAFWAPRLETCREKTLPHCFAQCEETGRISNFAKAGGLADGEREGYVYNDSDVYKVIEGAAYLLARSPDAKLEKHLDDLIAKIAAAQDEDGYLNTYFSLVEPGERWVHLRGKHELYCAGHLIEAAIAHRQATGKRSLFDIAVKLADHIDAVFRRGKKPGVPGHQELELALVKLSRETGEARYLELAKLFLQRRGRAEGRELFGEYCQDHLPVEGQQAIVGHAVRAMYQYCGMADVVRVAGEPGGYVEALAHCWNDVVLRKMYVTGGIGPSAHNEGFTVSYDLPNETAYAETCAAIGLVLWGHRMALLHADGAYADVMERALYNGLLSGISLDGTKFFYTNPLASWGKHHRQPWYGCACCPSNLVRFLPAVGRYIYATSDDAVYVNLYVAGQAKVSVGGGTIRLRQETRYPWDGKVRLTVELETERAFGIHLRIPGWCEGARLTVAGEPVRRIKTARGYASIRRTWRRGDVVELDMPMPVRRIESHPRVAANVGRVALQRGPIVYCLEAVDNGGRVRSLALPRGSRLRAEHRPDLLGGVTVVSGTGLVGCDGDWDDRLYQPAKARQVEFTAIPYYAWDNRRAGEMIVWLPESPTMADPAPMPGVTPSASHCYPGDTVLALCDRLEPTDSGDHTIPRFTWWSRRGSTEWVQYAFDAPRRVHRVEVFWFDDSRINGGCRAPARWRLLHKDGDSWKPVTGAGEYGTKLDEYNRVTFDPAKTDALRIEVQLQKDRSSGILEWKVGDGDV